MKSSLWRFIALPCFVGVLFFGYAYGLDLIAGALDISKIRIYYQELGLPQEWVKSLSLLGLIVPHLILVFLIATIFSYLAALLYEKYAVWVAVLAITPVLSIRGWELMEDATDLSRFSSVASFSISMFEIASLAALLCIGTYIRSRKLLADRHAYASPGGPL